MRDFRIDALAGTITFEPEPEAKPSDYLFRDVRLPWEPPSVARMRAHIDSLGGILWLVVPR